MLPEVIEKLQCLNLQIPRVLGVMTTLTDRLIYIVGHLKLQNALMASFLERETGAKCLAVEKFHDIQGMNNEKTGSRRWPFGTAWEMIWKAVCTRPFA